jgi:hypothetical protein
MTAAEQLVGRSMRTLEHLEPSPDSVPGNRFFHPDGGIQSSRVPGSSFSLGFGLSSIRRAQAIPDFPRHARGLRMKLKHAKRRAGPRCRR